MLSRLVLNSYVRAIFLLQPPQCWDCRRGCGSQLLSRWSMRIATSSASGKEGVNTRRRAVFLPPLTQRYRFSASVASNVTRYSRVYLSREVFQIQKQFGSGKKRRHNLFPIFQNYGTCPSFVYLLCSEAMLNFSMLI